MLENQDILCFSHDWTGDPLSKTHLMRLLAENNRVLWVNSIGYRAPKATASDLGRIYRKVAAAMQPIREVERNLFVLNPLAIPAWGSSVARQLNAKLLALQVRRAMRKLRFSRPINWVFNPAAGVVAGKLGEAGLIYYCVDEYTAFSGVPSEALTSLEADLLAKADLVVCSAQKLMETKRPSRAPQVLVRHGVDFEHFRQSLEATTSVPSDVAHLAGPVIGYFGLMSEDWVDVPLLVHVAKSFPKASLVMLGKVAMDLSPLSALPNVHLLGRRPYETLPAYCKAFDVAIIPFPISPVTLSANPLKAREYLAAGLPVVSTAIPEVEVLGQCLIGRTPTEFVERIHKALRQAGPSRQRSETMKTESWRSRLAEVCAHYADAVSHPQHQSRVRPDAMTPRAVQSDRFSAARDTIINV